MSVPFFFFLYFSCEFKRIFDSQRDNKGYSSQRVLFPKSKGWRMSGGERGWQTAKGNLRNGVREVQRTCQTAGMRDYASVVRVGSASCPTRCDQRLRMVWHRSPVNVEQISRKKIGLTSFIERTWIQDPVFLVFCVCLHKFSCSMIIGFHSISPKCRNCLIANIFNAINQGVLHDIVKKKKANCDWFYCNYVCWTNGDAFNTCREFKKKDTSAAGF